MPFQHWSEYNDTLIDLVDDGDGRRSALAGLTVGEDDSYAIGRLGDTAFGFVYGGMVEIDAGRQWTLGDGQYFCLPCPLVFDGIEGFTARVLCAIRLGYRGLPQVGGPVEQLGRLRYIDGCSDTLLVCPPVIGEPCLNFLHFPGGTDQTQHTHPSARMGIVARGHGWCDTPDESVALTPGLIFHIPKDGLHKFRTEPDQIMDVIAYHPDSDWGPQHDTHPMVNRTLVGGAKIDNTYGHEAELEVAAGPCGI